MARSCGLVICASDFVNPQILSLNAETSPVDINTWLRLLSPRIYLWVKGQVLQKLAEGITVKGKVHLENGPFFDYCMLEGSVVKTGSSAHKDGMWGGMEILATQRNEMLLLRKFWLFFSVDSLLMPPSP